MSGHVLIIDAMSNRRIHLRAQMDTAAFAVDLAETQADGLLRIQQDAPDVVIVADDLPGLRLRNFCKLLRSRPQTQLTTIIVAVPRENHSARISALSAGAHDVIDHQCDAAELRARLRNVLRTRQRFEDAHPRAGRDLAAGLAEAGSEFRHKTVATLVACGGGPVLDDHLTALREAGVNTHVISAAEARRQPDPSTDVHVIFETGSSPDARDLLGALLTHPASRHSRFLFVTDNLIETASPLDLGAHDQVPLSVSGPELALRINRLAERKQAADQARKATTELGEKAYTDALTGLNNREAIKAYMRKTDRALAEHPRPMAVLMADIDHFKAINDNHGHAGGDAVLAKVAGVLKADLREGDFLGRYGGEEFLVILPDVSAKQARCVAQRLCETVAACSTAIDDGTHVRVTISIGVALASRSDRKSTQDLLRAADNALYNAKRTGRNRISVATRDDTASVPKVQSVS